MLMLMHIEKVWPTSGMSSPLPAGWAPDGKAFFIRDKEAFSKLLPLFFQKTKFSSFARKLYRWRFKQVSIREEGPRDKKRTLFFHNENFRRDNKSLLSRMRCVTTSQGEGEREEAGTDADLLRGQRPVAARAKTEILTRSGGARRELKQPPGSSSGDPTVASLLGAQALGLQTFHPGGLAPQNGRNDVMSQISGMSDSFEAQRQRGIMGAYYASRAMDHPTESSVFSIPAQLPSPDIDVLPLPQILNYQSQGFPANQSHLPSISTENMSLGIPPLLLQQCPQIGQDTASVLQQLILQQQRQEDRRAAGTLRNTEDQALFAQQRIRQDLLAALLLQRVLRNPPAPAPRPPPSPPAPL